jgi:hypothetical protein
LQPEPQLADALNWIPTKLSLPIDCTDPVPCDLPDSYRKFLELVQPGEGFVGYEYLRLFGIEQLPWINAAYQVAKYLPGYYLFGSNGCGEAYLFAPANGPQQVIKMPFIPFDLEYLSESWPDFDHFLLALVSAPCEHDGSPYPDVPNPDSVGQEVHEIHPIVLGGSPSDSANQALVPVQKHVELVSFWNEAFQNIKRRSLKT